MVVALAFKLGAAPFHMWVPDVYHGAPDFNNDLSWYDSEDRCICDGNSFADWWLDGVATLVAGHVDHYRSTFDHCR